MSVRPLTKLQLLQRRAGVSQMELARRMGVSQTTVQRILSGEYRVDRYLEALARALGVSKLMVRTAARQLPAQGSSSRLNP